MSNLFGSIVNTSRALNVYGRSTEIAGQNLANVNNPEYARQRALVQSMGSVKVGGVAQSLGIEIGELTHARNALLDSQIVSETSLHGSLEARNRFNKTLELVLGESIDRSGDTKTIGSPEEVSASSGLSKAIDDFFNAMQEVSSHPTDGAKKQLLIEKANTLTGQFNKIDSRLKSAASDIETQIGSDIEAANIVLDKIASLNADINRFELGGSGAALGLRDQRQTALEELAKYIDFDVVAPPQGELAGSIKIQVTKSDATKLDLIDGQNVANKLSYSSNNYYAGSPAEQLNVSGGSLDGYADVKSNLLTNLQGTVDNLAKQMITSFNATYPTNFFDPSAGNANAGNIQLDSGLTAASLTVGTGGASSNDTMRAMIALRDSTFATGSGDEIDGTFKGYYSKQISSAAQEISSVGQQLENESLVKSMLEERRNSEIGVSIDEEVAKLLRSQRAFQATAKVFTVLDEMLQQIVNGLVR